MSSVCVCVCFFFISLSWKFFFYFLFILLIFVCHQQCRVQRERLNTHIRTAECHQLIVCVCVDGGQAGKEGVCVCVCVWPLLFLFFFFRSIATKIDTLQCTTGILKKQNETKQKNRNSTRWYRLRCVWFSQF